MSIRKLANETLIYGLSSILGRFVNFLLVPLYTWVLLDSEFGDIAYFYALIGFLKVFFTLQLDTAFFRFGKDPNERPAAYAAILRPVCFYILSLGAILYLASPWLADWTGYPTYGADFQIIAFILVLDAFTEFPMARLRLEQRPIRFATIRLIGIANIIVANVLLLWLLPKFFSETETPWLYPESRLTLVLLANLLGSAVTFTLVAGDIRFLFRKEASMSFKPILQYAGPLIFVSLAGVVNEMLDRQLLRYFLPGSFDEVRAQIGIYSANYRLAMIIALFTQAFRYAAEPFFFRHADQKDAPVMYARVTRYYTLAASAGLLAILLFKDWLKFFIGREGSSYHEGLGILPILLCANLLLGLYYNFSVWYKLTDKTFAGAWIAAGGAFITILGNILMIPLYGYFASAWVTLICYAFMVWASLIWGQRHYPIPYPLMRMAGYFGSAILLAIGFDFFLDQTNTIIKIAVASLCLLGYALFWYHFEKQTIREYGT
ncbi:MAG: polysaccharide biosynthesis protein [Saprospiraceae bacterium]|nr:polysaccharide biosynthesis protein [Saprospiraceae bacterium]